MKIFPDRWNGPSYNDFRMIKPSLPLLAGLNSGSPGNGRPSWHNLKKAEGNIFCHWWALFLCWQPTRATAVDLAVELPGTSQADDAHRSG